MSDQVSVDGRRQGCVKKHYGTPKSEVAIARRRMAEEVLSVVGELPKNVTYAELKEEALKRNEGHRKRRLEFRERMKWPDRRTELDAFLVIQNKSASVKEVDNKDKVVDKVMPPQRAS